MSMKCSLFLLLEFKDDFVFFLLELPHEFVKALVYVIQLLFKHARKLFFDLLDRFRIVLYQPLRIVNHFPQVNHILLHRVC